jgi:glycosyltransferase involved in cell wall biosynthesis
MLCKDGGYWRCLRYKCHKQSAAASLIYMTEAYFNRSLHKYEAVSRFLCPSQFVRGALVDAGIAAERAIYHPNALDPGKYDPNYEPGEYILYAGRLSAEKGILTLLDAVERTRIPLRIAGTGPLDSAIRARVVDRKLTVRMEGHCTGDRLRDLYRQAAFVVLPSEWYENASMTALESFAYGKPVLASRIGGNPELVVDGDSGCLFTPGDAVELASLIGSLWENRAALAKMGRRARFLLEQKFTQTIRLKNLLDIYRSVCSQSSVAQ